MVKLSKSYINNRNKEVKLQIVMKNFIYENVIKTCVTTRMENMIKDSTLV